MIVFEFSYDGDICYLGTTDCTESDKAHSKEIYEQLDAQACGLTEGV